MGLTVGAVLARDKAGRGSLLIASSLIAGKHRSHRLESCNISNKCNGNGRLFLTPSVATLV